MDNNKFQLVEENAKDAPVDNIEWEGEKLQADSTTRLQDDKGAGQALVLRFFDFAANPEAFAQHKPSAEELFTSHRKGIEALLWKDGLKPYYEIDPRLILSKDKKTYRFAITCLANEALIDTPQTLGELIAHEHE